MSSEGTRQKRRRGGVSAWAKSHFTLHPPAPDPPDAAVKPQKRHKAEKAAEMDPRTLWRCARCGAELRLPTDAATGRPRYQTLVSHLAAECAAGPLPVPSAAELERAEAEARRAAAGGEAELARQRDSLAELLAGDAEAREGLSGGVATRVFVVLQNPKTPANLGSILRAMDCFNTGAAATYCGVVYSGTRLGHALAAAGGTAHTDTTGAAARIPCRAVATLQVLFDALAALRRRPSVRSAEAIAVDMIAGATPLHRFEHDGGCPPPPARGAAVRCYLFGAEDGSLSPAYLAQCQRAVFVHTRRSLNLAATVTVVLYDREAKRLREESAGGDGFECRNVNNSLTWSGGEGAL